MTTSAYGFRSAMTIEEMLENLVGFRPRESAVYGLYLAGHPSPGARLRIFEEGERFLLDILFHGGDWEAFHASVLDDLLPSIGARDIRPGEAVG